MIYIVLLILSLVSCNLVSWNYKRIHKKLGRAEIMDELYSNDTHTVHYYEGGSGPHLILLHGFGGDAMVTWYRSLLDLSKDYHVIAPDLLWFGKSKSKMPASMDAQVDALKSLLVYKGISDFNLVGISYGGFVSIAFQDAYPNMIRKLCIVDSPGMTYNVSLLDTLCREQNVASIEDIFVVKDEKGVQRLLDLAFLKQKKLPKRIRQNTYELMFSENHEELTALISSLKAEAGRYELKNVSSFPKTLVIWGAHDRVFPLEEGRKLADSLDAEFSVIPKSGHAPNLENFRYFEKELRAFLAN